MSEARSKRRVFYLLVDDWIWWFWLITASLLAVGLMGNPSAYLWAMGLTTIQLLIVLGKERRLTAFSVQLRLVYLAILLITFIPPLRFLYWIPMLGTFALVIFGYCLLSRLLSLLPWNREYPLTQKQLRRTFLTPPDLTRVSDATGARGCAGGICTIQAQMGLPEDRSQ